METLRRQLTPELEIIIPLDRSNLGRIRKDGTFDTMNFTIATRLQPGELDVVEKARLPYLKRDMVMAKLHELSNVMDTVGKNVTNDVLDTCLEPLDFLYDQIFNGTRDTATAQTLWNKESVEKIKYYMQEILYQELTKQSKTNPELERKLHELIKLDEIVYNLNVIHVTTEPDDIIRLWLEYNAQDKNVKPLRSFLNIRKTIAKPAKT